VVGANPVRAINHPQLCPGVFIFAQMTKGEFWKSFGQHLPALEQMISRDARDYNAYNELSDDLLAYGRHLVPEITMDSGDRFVLVISCDGNKEGIGAVELLTKDIKEYPNWKIIKYRQPGPMGFIPLLGQKVYRKDILLTWEKLSNGQYKLTFHLKWHQNNQTQRTGAILHLDHTIGEYAAMTRIDDVQFKSLRLFKSKEGLKTLDDLKAEIDSA
jgi:hypothetical protein